MIKNGGDELLSVSGDTFCRVLIVNKLYKAALARILADEELAVSCEALLVQLLKL